MGSKAKSPKGPRLRTRRATTRDLDVLVHQRRAMWTDMGIEDMEALDRADAEYRKWARTRLAKGDLIAWIVEDTHKTVAGGGCVWLQPIQPRPGLKVRRQPYLLSMYTEPAYRGKGIATEIVAQALEWTKKNGYPSLALHSSRMGRNLYKSHGFKRTWEMKISLVDPNHAPTRALRL